MWLRIVQNEGVLEEGEILKHIIWERRMRGVVGTSSRKP